RVDPELEVTFLGVTPGSTLTATDYAGNVATVPVAPVPEKLYVLHARDFVSFLEKPTDPRGEESRPLMWPPIAERDAQGREIVNAFVPVTDFDLAETLRGSPPQGERFQFEFKRRTGGAWGQSGEIGAQLRLDFAALGLDFGDVYRGRFSCNAQNGTFRSESFLFRPCSDYMRLVLEGRPDPQPALFIVPNGGIEPLVGGRISFVGKHGRTVKTFDGQIAQGLPMEADGKGGLFWALNVDLLQVCMAQVVAIGASGTEYAPDGRCRLLEMPFPCEPPSGNFKLDPPEEQLCGNPDVARFRVEENAIGRVFHVEGDPDGAPFPITSFVGEGVFYLISHDVLVDLRRVPQDRDLVVRVYVDPKDDEPDI